MLAQWWLVFSLFSKLFLSKKKRYDRGNLTRVRFEFFTEGFEQKLFLAAHANYRADREHHDRDQQSDPMANRETRRQQHPKHPGIDRIPHDTIRPFCH